MEITKKDYEEGRNSTIILLKNATVQKEIYTVQLEYLEKKIVEFPEEPAKATNPMVS